MNINSLSHSALPISPPSREVVLARQVEAFEMAAAAARQAAAADPVSASFDVENAGMQSEELKGAVDAINAFLKPVSSSIEFSIDEDSGKTIVKLMDKETNTVLRQYPTREALAIAKDIDKFQGMLVNTEA
jgi:flagellar protein FlaG